MWHEGIEDAWKNFKNENKSSCHKTLQYLHSKMMNKPESLSEIAFHQSFGADFL